MTFRLSAHLHLHLGFLDIEPYVGQWREVKSSYGSAHAQKPSTHGSVTRSKGLPNESHDSCRQKRNEREWVSLLEFMNESVNENINKEYVCVYPNLKN